MLGVNLLFAGFALTLNGLSYLTKVDDKAKAAANLLVGIIIGLNAIFQTIQADSFTFYGFAAAMWLFSLNYLIIAAHIFFKSDNWKVFGLYGLFAAIVSITFAVEGIIIKGPWEMTYMWIMWVLLWAQSFFSILVGSKAIGKITPHILILNGIASTFIPGFLILLGIIF